MVHGLEELLFRRQLYRGLPKAASQGERLFNRVIVILKTPKLPDVRGLSFGRLAADLRHQVTHHRQQHAALFGSIIGQYHMGHHQAVGRAEYRRVASRLTLVVKPLREHPTCTSDGSKRVDVPRLLAHDRRRALQRVVAKVNRSELAGIRGLGVGASFKFQHRTKPFRDSVKDQQFGAGTDAMSQLVRHAVGHGRVVRQDDQLGLLQVIGGGVQIVDDGAPDTEGIEVL